MAKKKKGFGELSEHKAKSGKKGEKGEKGAKALAAKMPDGDISTSRPAESRLANSDNPGAVASSDEARASLRDGANGVGASGSGTPVASDEVRAKAHVADKPDFVIPGASDEPLGATYYKGPVILRGHMIPKETTTEHLLSAEEPTDWLHMDPWRVLRIQAEFVDGFGALAELGPAVACYGSARTKRTDPMYRAARHVGRKLAERGVAVITGGGPGIMEAVNRGAADVGGKSVGLGIELPHEEGINRWVNIGMTFRYFFVRKTMFVKYSRGAVVFPGGFGTLDESFELLTLVQTHKVAMTPIVMFGTEYWSGLFEWLEKAAVGAGMISELDPKLVVLTDDEDEAVAVATSTLV